MTRLSSLHTEGLLPCPKMRSTSWKQWTELMDSMAQAPWNACQQKLLSPSRLRDSRVSGLKRKHNGKESGCRRRLRHQGGRVQILRSEEHTSELQSRENLVCRLLLEKKKI